MQAYALQRVIKKIGCDTVTANKSKNVFSTRFILGTIKRFIVSALTRNDFGYISPSMNEALALNTRSFISRYINTIDIQNGRRRPLAQNVEKYDAFVTGSDQVWRAGYTDVAFQMFDYIHYNAVIISYAASFGKNDLSEYRPNLIKKTVKLAKKFSSISVRENTGVDIVRRYWNQSAEQHVDPTLLLTESNYRKLVDDSDVVLHKSKGNIFVYVLDRDDASNSIIQKVEHTTKEKAFEILPEAYPNKKALLNDFEKYALPPVEQWLKSFMDAKFVITDSFHGTVFSIIFNKPFIAITNKTRGTTRFTSLLKMFELEDRLISDVSEVTPELINAKIDWEKVNKIKVREQKRSMDYLRKHLG